MFAAATTLFGLPNEAEPTKKMDHSCGFDGFLGTWAATLFYPEPVAIA